MNTGPSPSPGKHRLSRKPRGGVVVPHQATLLQRIGARLLHLFISLVSWTVRYKVHDGANILKGHEGPVILCIWHNRLALCLPIYNRFARKDRDTAGMAAMASASKDGAFISAVLECFGVHPARGSSSRRGPQALLELTGWAHRGFDLAITPDGPRGPRYKVQPGVVSLAQVTGLPIIPCTYNLSWKVRVNSWDAFQVPLPFARCDVHLGEGFRVPRQASEAERKAVQAQLEASLNALSND